MTVYRTVSENELNRAVEDFLREQADEISSAEFDEIFENTRDALLTVGTFSEGRRNGENFLSSRYVDQVSCVGVSVDEGFPTKILIRAADLAHRNAGRDYVILFDLYPEYIASFPNKILGTIDLG